MDESTEETPLPTAIPIPVSTPTHATWIRAMAAIVFNINDNFLNYFSIFQYLKAN